MITWPSRGAVSSFTQRCWTQFENKNTPISSKCRVRSDRVPVCLFWWQLCKSRLIATAQICPSIDGPCSPIQALLLCTNPDFGAESMKNNNKRPLLGIGNFLLKRLRWNVFNLPKTRSSARFIVHQWGATVEQSVNPSKLTEVVFHFKMSSPFNNSLSLAPSLASSHF